MINLGIDTIKSVLESCKKVSDEKVAKMDDTLAGSNLEKMWDDACPITSEVFDKLKEATADPKNLKMVMDENGDLYVEASEFINFCEAANVNPGEAVDLIAEEYNGTITPGTICCDRFHVVFPQNLLSPKRLGTDPNNMGYNMNDSWGYKLMRGCMMFGIKCDPGMDKKAVDKEDDGTVTVEDN